VSPLCVLIEEQWKQLVQEKESALQAAENRLRIKLEDADNKLRWVKIFSLSTVVAHPVSLRYLPNSLLSFFFFFSFSHFGFFSYTKKKFTNF
jgi:hypothetical protein